MTNISKSHQQRRLLLLLAVLFLCAAGVFCDSGAGVKFRVFAGPSKLKEKLSDDITVSLGNFGYVPWGKTLTGNLYPAEPEDACTELKPFILDDDENAAPIVLVKRGGCTFVTKVANARAQGARMVVIVNNDDVNVAFVEMVEDNTGIGKNLDIPTVMVGKVEGGILQEAVNNYYKDLKTRKNKDQDVDSDSIEPVAIRVKFPWNKREKADTEIWVSPGSPKSMDFIASIKEKGQTVLKGSKFKARYAVWRCNSCQEGESWKEKNPDNCLGGGRYCQPKPDDNGPQTGAIMLDESLRQLCIFDKAKDQYFQYIKEFNSTCVFNMVFKKDKRLDIEDCSTKAMKEVNIKVDKITECVEKSWRGCKSKKNCENERLEEEYKLFNKRGIAVWPAVIINGQTFKGNLIAEEVINQVCMGFEENKAPEGCSRFVVDPKVVIDDPNAYQGSNFWGTFFWVLFFLAIIMVAFFYYYRRFVRRAMVDEMNDQIQSAVATYFKMGDNKSGPNNA